MRIPLGSNVPPPHGQAGNEEHIHVQEEALRCAVGGETRDLTAGQIIGTPRGAVLLRHVSAGADTRQPNTNGSSRSSRD